MLRLLVIAIEDDGCHASDLPSVIDHLLVGLLAPARKTVTSCR